MKELWIVMLLRKRENYYSFKNTAIDYEGVRINIIDMGHADFGGEVERVLKWLILFTL